MMDISYASEREAEYEGVKVSFTPGRKEKM